MNLCYVASNLGLMIGATEMYCYVYSATAERLTNLRYCVENTAERKHRCRRAMPYQPSAFIPT